LNDAIVKKSGVLAFSAILMFSLMVGARSVSLVSGNGIPAPPINRIFIESNGTITPSTVPIVRNGDVYTLTQDIPNSSIVVKRDNIVIDGAGYSLQGYGTSYYDGIIISYRKNITITNMDISPFGHGVRMDYASNNTILGNKMRVFTGVSLLYSDYNQIIGNEITDGYGVSGSGSNNLILGNNFTSGLSGGGNGMGVYLSGDNNTISHNIIRHEVSLNLGSCHYNTISNNTILDGESGILLAKSSNNLVFGNVIKGKEDSRSGALYISEDSFGNIVFANNFENNALAVSLGAQVADTVWNNVYNNTFYHNNFVDNVQDVWVASGAPFNSWDDGENGNYWSDYAGADADGDGIGDTPYFIADNNQDNYPLMTAFDITNIALPSPSPTPTASPTSTPSPTPNPTSIPSPEQSPTATSSPTPEPPSEIPEFALWVILPLFATVGLVGWLFHKKKLLTFGPAA
jgi:parallel beta-helix repeat protein